MLWLLYNVIFLSLFLFFSPYYLWRMGRRGGYRKDFLQRFAIYRPEVLATLREGDRAWIHAVSVGEIYIAFRLMDEIRQCCPKVRFLLSTTTSTAHAIAEKRVRFPDLLIYFPLDLPVFQNRLFRLVRPRLLALIECELWPNLIRAARRTRVPLYLVNGRISSSSFRGYRRLSFLTRRLLPSFNKLYVQTAEDGARLIALGASPDRICVTGSAKYETVRDPESAKRRARAILRAAGFDETSRFWIAASTWPGEEAAALDAHRHARQKYPNLRLVIAPRHVERTSEILREIRIRGLSVIRRSEVAADHPAPESISPADVFLLDTTGELKDFYSVADVVFVGKSLTDHGGQNPIEPAAWGCAVLVGPHMENFGMVIQDLKNAGAVIQIPSPAELTAELIRLLNNEASRIELGRRAEALIREKAGILRRMAEEIARVL